MTHFTSGIRWFGSLRLRTKFIIIVVVLALIASSAGAVYAQWSRTKQASTTALVLGTFSITDLSCEDAVTDQKVNCYANVSNEFNEPVVLVSGSMLSSIPGITLYNPEVGGPDPGMLPYTIQPGQTVPLIGAWKPDGSVPLGTVVDLTMEISATGGS